MKVKTSDLTGASLDWAVAKCEGGDMVNFKHQYAAKCYQYSSDWAQGGPIIEREFIESHTYSENDDGIVTWRANDFMDGPTPLIAAMRCFVALQLGDEVEVPDELCHTDLRRCVLATATK